jgi:hypothetical protein
VDRGYLAWPLESFVNAELSRLAMHLDQTRKHPQAVKRCWLHEAGEIECQLKEAQCDRRNGTLEGSKESHRNLRANDPEHVDESRPPTPPPDGGGTMDSVRESRR